MTQASPPWPPARYPGDDGGRSAVRRTEPSAPVAEHGDAEQPVVGWPEIAGWAGRHRTLLGGLALIAATAVWKGMLLRHFFFWQDDFRFLDRAIESHFTWKYLMSMESGHLIPGPYAIAWLLARISLYSWGLALGVTLVLLAAADLAAFRLLWTLFGNRPAILVPLTVYLLSPLTLPGLGWWSSAIESLPLQLATFMALNAHVHYLRTGRFRHAVAAGVWLAAGMLFFEKGMVLPFLLFAVTSGFFVTGRWLTATRRAATWFWPAWLLYGAILGSYATLFVVQLRTSAAAPVRPAAYHAAFSFVADLLKSTFLPGAFGGPWRWLPSGALAYTAAPPVLSWLAWLLAAATVAVSLRTRGRAWRAWAILLGWIAAADMAPVILGRVKQFDAAMLGLDTRYLADAVPVLVICLGLAFWRVAGRPDERKVTREHSAAGGRPAAAGVVFGAFVFGAFVSGSCWAAQAYLDATTSAPARTFVANADAALTSLPYGSLIADRPVPSAVMSGLFGTYAFDSSVVGVLARSAPPGELRWVAHPAGTLDKLMIFAKDGKLHQPAIVGSVSPALPPGRNCFAGRGWNIPIPFGYLARGGPTLRISYYDAVPGSREVTVTAGARRQRLSLQAGLHDGYLPVSGPAAGVDVAGLTSRQLCISKVEMGLLVPLDAPPATSVG